MWNGKLYLILDDAICRGKMSQMAQSALSAGVKVVQLRAKYLSDAELLAQAKQIRQLTYQYEATLIINDRLDIALAVQADGLHLGQEDMDLSLARQLIGYKIIGLSTHTLTQAKEAEKKGADYIGLGPIFKTQTKLHSGKPLGLELITKVKKVVNLPVVAIGGINEHNAASVLDAGADGLAVASAILNQPDVQEATLRLLSIGEQHNHPDRSG